ncbi:MAG: RluA family pseudouridine synthase [Ruminococcus bromii]|nr:RluA family pseudouridine synthase [Ruminococcus bromii]
MRLDKYLTSNTDISRSKISEMIKEGLVLVNGKQTKSSYILRLNDNIEITGTLKIETNAKAEDIPLDIVYEDDNLMVINKPSGMVVHPAAGHFSGTLVNALLAHTKDLSSKNGDERPGIVHRIDKDTSGLLVVAKNDKTHEALANQLKDKTLSRIYVALVKGRINHDTGTIDAPIGRNPKDRKKMCVIEKNSKNAVTHYSVITRYKGYTHIKCKLETGRTHQIRVHMAYIGHPVSGDKVYGVKNEKVDFEGQCLHARKIGFIHPKTSEYIEFTSELPDYFKKYLKKLENISSY